MVGGINNRARTCTCWRGPRRLPGDADGYVIARDKLHAKIAETVLGAKVRPAAE